MLDEKLLMDIVHDFDYNQNYKFTLVNYKNFLNINENTLWLELKLEFLEYNERKNLQIIKSDIKKRLSNLLGLDRVILYFRLKS